MSKFHEKAQAKTKQIVGQMVGDDRLVQEGQEQEQKAEEKDDARKKKPESPDDHSNRSPARH